MGDKKALWRKGAAMGAVGMSLMLVPSVSGLSAAGWILAIVLTGAAIPAYLGNLRGVTILRTFYWLLLVGWGFMAATYYFVGPLDGTPAAPGLFFSIGIFWCGAGILALAPVSSGAERSTDAAGHS